MKIKKPSRRTVALALIVSLGVIFVSANLTYGVHKQYINWAGAEASIKGLDGIDQPISEISATILVSQIYSPPPSQIDRNVDQVMTSWVGLTNNSAKLLAQTGYVGSVSNNGTFTLFYEVWPSELMQFFQVEHRNYTTNVVRYYYTPVYVNPGEKINFKVVRGLGQWMFEATLSNGTEYNATDYHENFTAYQAELITEAYSMGSSNITQQIARFSTVSFYSAIVYSQGKVYNFSMLRYELIWMDQTGYGNFNVESHFSDGTLVTNWQNSNYDYSYIKEQDKNI